MAGRIKRKEQRAAAIGDGDIEIVLEGETMTLKPTLFAATRISQLRGGFGPVSEAIGNMNLEVITAVIALGLGLTAHGAKELPEKVWRTGVLSLMVPAAKFVNVLANGGRPLGIAQQEDEDDENPQKG